MLRRTPLMPPNVLQFISSGGFYGAERVLLELARFAAQQGLGSRILVMESPGADAIAVRAAAWGIPCDRMSGSLRQPAHLRAELTRYLAAHQIDLIHTHGYKTDVLARWTDSSRPLRRVATCHSWYSTSAKLRFYEWLDKRALRRFDHVVAVSQEILDDLRRTGFSTERTSTVLNGIALDPPAPGFDPAKLRAELGAAPGERLILRIGRLAESKCNDVLLSALASVDRSLPWRLALVGEGECLEPLRAQAAGLGLGDRVAFAGFRSDVHDLLRAADLMVIPSRQEGLPIVLLEAMAARVPVVSTRVGEIPSVLTDGRSGWLVAPDDPAALSNAIAQALADPAAASARAASAHADYLAGFSQAAMGQAYLDIYTRLTGTAAPRPEVSA